MSETTNDNDRTSESAALRGPDAHGQAALLLVESVIHGLVERSVITVPEAIEMIEVAAEIKTQVAAEWGDSPANLEKSLSLLATIAQSFRTESGPANS